jgi:hypothetical protein
MAHQSTWTRSWQCPELFGAILEQRIGLSSLGVGWGRRVREFRLLGAGWVSGWGSHSSVHTMSMFYLFFGGFENSF